MYIVHRTKYFCLNKKKIIKENCLMNEIYWSVTSINCTIRIFLSFDFHCFVSPKYVAFILHHKSFEFVGNFVSFQIWFIVYSKTSIKVDFSLVASFQEFEILICKWDFRFKRRMNTQYSCKRSLANHPV